MEPDAYSLLSRDFINKGILKGLRPNCVKLGTSSEDTVILQSPAIDDILRN